MTNVSTELAVLPRLSNQELIQKWIAVFGEGPRSKNRAWLLKRIAWRIQALAEGDLSERARRRAEELANDADLRLTAPRVAQAAAGLPAAAIVSRDRRLPMPGTVLTRKYKGETITVFVRPDGFEYAGRQFRSLTAVARIVTGTQTNGFLFFRLGKYADEFGSEAEQPSETAQQPSPAPEDQQATGGDQ